MGRRINWHGLLIVLGVVAYYFLWVGISYKLPFKMGEIANPFLGGVFGMAVSILLIAMMALLICVAVPFFEWLFPKREKKG